MRRSTYFREAIDSRTSRDGGGVRGRHNGLASAITAVWGNRDRNLILAKALCVGLSFLGYDLFVAADSRLGKVTLWRAFWARRARP